MNICEGSSGLAQACSVSNQVRSPSARVKAAATHKPSSEINKESRRMRTESYLRGGAGRMRRAH